MAGSYSNLTRMVPTTKIFGSRPEDRQDIAEQKPLGLVREKTKNGWLNSEVEEA